MSKLATKPQIACSLYCIISVYRKLAASTFHAQRNEDKFQEEQEDSKQLIYLFKTHLRM